MLLPALNKVREQAKKVKCLNNIKECGLALQMYATDFSGFVPVIVTGTTPQSTTVEKRYGLTFVTECGYFAKESNVLACPSGPPAGYDPKDYPSGKYGVLRPSSTMEAVDGWYDANYDKNYYVTLYRANFKTIGFFLLITHFLVRQAHLDTSDTTFFIKNRKKSIF